MNSVFSTKIRNNFPFEPTEQQAAALEKLTDFLFDRNSDAVFLLKGYAGTGKSSLVGAVVKTINELNQKVILLAPTGRAAKVFASYSGQNAFTIHKKIYRQKAFSGESGGFVQADNLHKHTLFIVDEASMISNDGLDTGFGSGRLLDDLIHYVYSGDGCRLVLLGDSAQLPPVSQTESPALDAEILRGYGLAVHETTLTQVVRQAEKSGILMNATALRKALNEGTTELFPQIRLKGFPDVVKIGGEELIEAIGNSYHAVGMQETIIITRSNKRAGIYNNGIRNRVLMREEELSSGDMLMVVKNNYFWAKNDEKMGFIANGDLMQVLRVRKSQELYGFRFCDLLVRFPDYDIETEVKILMETLQTDAPALPKEQSDKLFYTILEDYEDVPSRREKMKRMKENPFFNAVQVKYAYAVTCHKAQGGQWQNVFLDISYVPQEYLGIDFYRWLYTAFTRASDRIFLVNPAKELIENC